LKKEQASRQDEKKEWSRIKQELDEISAAAQRE